MKTLTELLPLFESVANILIPLIFAVLIPIVVKLIKSKLGSDQQRILRSAVEAAFWGVEKVSRKTDTKVDDKVATGLKVLGDSLGRPPTSEEERLAKMWFDEMHEKKKRGIYPNSLSLASSGNARPKKK